MSIAKAFLYSLREDREKQRADSVTLVTNEATATCRMFGRKLDKYVITCAVLTRDDSGAEIILRFAARKITYVVSCNGGVVEKRRIDEDLNMYRCNMVEPVLDDDIVADIKWLRGEKETPSEH